MREIFSNETVFKKTSEPFHHSEGPEILRYAFDEGMHHQRHWMSHVAPMLDAEGAIKNVTLRSVFIVRISEQNCDNSSGSTVPKFSQNFMTTTCMTISFAKPFNLYIMIDVPQSLVRRFFSSPYLGDMLLIAFSLVTLRSASQPSWGRHGLRGSGQEMKLKLNLFQPFGPLKQILALDTPWTKRSATTLYLMNTLSLEVTMTEE